jgi:hypothetical protein
VHSEELSQAIQYCIAILQVVHNLLDKIYPAPQVNDVYKGNTFVVQFPANNCE